MRGRHDGRLYIENDVVHLHSGLVPPRQDAQEFYKGYDTGFGCILQNLDIRRPITDSVLVDTILLDDKARKNGELFLLKGPGGNGKTVALKRVAWEAAVSYDKLAFYVDGAAGLRFEPLNEIFELTGKRIFLFVDRIALLRDELARLLAACRARKFPLTVIGAERENEWHIYCENLVSFTSQEFSVAYLSKLEVADLIEILDKHRALGLLTDRTPAERMDAFLTRAERQLLVALHETTLGVPFEKIVLDEFNRVKPRQAQQLYLQICALHQFGAPVRAGLVSRTSGVSFQEFGESFLKPLADVVLVDEPRHSSGDVFYRSRHQHVSELVFNLALSSEEDKFGLLSNLMLGINVDYSSDNETFSRMIRGRVVARMFMNVDLGRLLYDKAEQTAKGESFVPHQRAVFELQHQQGSLANAEVAAARAAQMNGNSRSIRHTQAEIARRQAIAAVDPLLKQSYRRVARERIAQDTSRLTEYDLHTRAKIAIDELRELVGRNSKETSDSLLLAATKEAETAVQRGRVDYPESSEILAAESDLRDLLNQAPLALASLERAFKLNPRQDWLAIRLARRYTQGGDAPRAIKTIEQCLFVNPDSKTAHLQLAQLLEQSGASSDKILPHLRSSFTSGDNNFEGQFWYGRQLFLGGRASDSQSIFDSLSERAPGRFRTDASAPVQRTDGSPKSFDGIVIRKEEG
jgi:tetratricopeptide (TPR) repeat protein